VTGPTTTDSALGAIVTLGTIRLALIAYAVWIGSRIIHRRSIALGQAAGWFGLALFAVHVVAAMLWYYDASLARAWAETARRTGEMTGTRSGAGLILNFVFGAVWVWLLSRERGPTRDRLRACDLAGHAFLLFLVIQATVVFGTGLIRPAGAIGLATLFGVWAWRRTQPSSPSATSSPDTSPPSPPDGSNTN
jgi:hypothetical protein